MKKEKPLPQEDKELHKILQAIKLLDKSKKEDILSKMKELESKSKD